MLELVEKNLEQIAAICRRYRVRRLDAFGSAVRGDFDARRSDIDCFYEFEPADTSDIANRFFRLKEDLERLLGVELDLVSARDAANSFFLEVANRHRRTLYAA